MRIEDGYIISEGKLIHVLYLCYNDIGLVEYGDSEYMYKFSRLFIKRANQRNMISLLQDIRFKELDNFDIESQFLILKFIMTESCDGKLIDTICSSTNERLKELLNSF